jgi:hypothetical protein
MSTLRFASLAFSFAFAALVVAPALARAQGAPPPASPYYQPAPPPAGGGAPPPAAVVARDNRRVGFELDIGLQGGEINCSSPNGECDGFVEAGGLDVGGTYMFTPKLGINGQVWVMAHSNDGWRLSQIISTVGVELRPVPILSLQLGVGHAHAELSTDRGNLVVGSDDAPAVMLGASLDVVRSRRWVIDVQAKFGQGFYGDRDDDGEADVVARNLGLGAGFTYLF